MNVRIVKISLGNYRAFLGENNTIVLPDGENLLLYGENGSGKSSLFRGMDDFLTSSAGAVNLLDKANMFREEGQQPNISVTFSHTEQTENRPYFVNQVQEIDLIKKANLSKAFWGYADVQAIHASERRRSGHFHTLLQILKDYEYRALNVKLVDIWRNLERESQKRWSNRLEESIVKQVNILNAAMMDMSQALTDKMKEILLYFDEQLRIDFDYTPASYDRYQKLQVPYINIRVSYFNQTLGDSYSEVLNEARLSSLALSLYLASLLTRPPLASPYKILFLDDALIGLDSGNRIPLLRILNDLFGDYQIFLTTYDRHWYEMAKDWFEKESLKQASPEIAKWKYYEMYSILAPNKQYSFPVILPTDSFLGKANRHMNNPVYPDYAAAANNFRKAAEEILLKELPEHLLKDGEGETPLLMLKALLERCDNFLSIIEQPKTHTIELAKYLRILLNPLSHYNPETPIHKGELLQIEPVLVALQSQLRSIRDESVYQVLGVPEDKTVRFRFSLLSGSTGFYIFELKNYLYRYVPDSSALANLNDVKVTRVQMYQELLNGSTQQFQLNPQNYQSLSEAFTSIIQNLIDNNSIAPLAANANFKDVLEVQQGGIWKPYQEIITTP